MAKDLVDGNWGQPQFDVNGALEEGVDDTIISNYFAAMVARRFTNWAALAGASVPGNGYLARVDTIPGALFVRVSGAWAMFGVPEFASTSARDAAITAPVAGWRCRVAGVDYEYTSAGWRLQQINVSLRKSASQTLTNAGTEYTLSWDTELTDPAGIHDNATNNSRILIGHRLGLWRIEALVRSAQTSGYCGAVIKKNGTVIPGSTDDRPGAAGSAPALRPAAFVIADNASDYVEVFATSSVAGSLVSGGSTQTGSTFSATFLGSNV